MSATDYKPLTVVDDATACSIETLAKRVEESRAQNGDLLQRYHDLWYTSGHTWHYTHFLGIGLMKCPNDLWIYQDLIARLKPTIIIETGTYQGASALWFAFLLDMMRIKEGRVITVDIHDYRKTGDVLHPRITWCSGNSADPKMAAAIAEQLPEEGRRLIILDSDHSAEHVRNEMDLYAPMVRPGDYLVVEDTNISWSDGKQHVVREVGETQWGKDMKVCACGQSWNGDWWRCPNDTGDRGARGGVEDYLLAHPGEFVQDIMCERYLLTMNPGGWLQRVKECSHV
jgi:cephalosporin hydroxylase